MKKLFLILFLVVSAVCFGQYPISQNIGSPNTLVQVPANGGFKGSLVNRTFADTTAANATQIDAYAGAQIYTTGDDKLWTRNAAATAWTEVGSGGGGGFDRCGLQSGGFVAWDSALVFDVSPAVYCILDVNYTSAQTQVTLAAAHATLTRIDIIALDASGVIVIQGTPAASPSEPNVLPTQIRLVAIQVNPAATTPAGVSSITIYDENAGVPTEWATGSSGVTVDYNNTTAPFHLTKAGSTGAVTSASILTFTNNADIDLTNYNVLTFHVRLKSEFAEATQLQVYWINNNVKVSQVLNIGTGTFGYTRTTVGSYQQITIPVGSFLLTQSSVDAIYVQTSGSNADGLYIDYIRLQTGIVQPPPQGGTLTNFLFINGSGFDGTVTNPTTTPTLSLTTSLTATRVPFIGANGALTQDADFNYISGTNTLGTATGNFTLTGVNLTLSGSSSAALASSAGSYTLESTGRFYALTARTEEAYVEALSSATELVLTTGGNFFRVTGNTTIESIDGGDAQAGTRIGLIFVEPAITLTNNGSSSSGHPMLLAGRANYTFAAGDVIEFRFDGNNWIETQRTLASSSGVTTITATDANGFDFTITNPTTTPNIALTTTVTDDQLYVSNSGALSGSAFLTSNGSRLKLLVNSTTAQFRLEGLEDDGAHGLDIWRSNADGFIRFNATQGIGIVDFLDAGTSMFRMDNGSVRMPEVAAPSTPAANHAMIYAKSDGFWYGKDDAGVETKLSNDGSGTVTSVAATDGNGFDFTITNPTSTPNISLTTTVTNTHVMYSNSGAVTGSANLTWDNTNKTLAAFGSSSGTNTIGYFAQQGSGITMELDGVGGIPLFIVNGTTSTNTTFEQIRLRTDVTSGSGAAGIGGSIGWTLEASDGTPQSAGSLAVSFTTATIGSETAQMLVTLKNSGASATRVTFGGDGRVTLTGRLLQDQGADVASAAGAIAVGNDGDVFEITGTAAITLISNVGWQNGAKLTLIFTSTASLADGTANSGTDIGMELAGGATFNASDGDVIVLLLSEIGGTQRWREVSRSVN